MKTLDAFWADTWKAKGVFVVAYLLGRGGNDPLDFSAEVVKNLLALAGAG